MAYVCISVVWTNGVFSMADLRFPLADIRDFMLLQRLHHQTHPVG